MKIIGEEHTVPCEKPLLSIIVPVYDVERYLPKCIDSILAQTFTDFELILVEDGSPDNCPALCDAAAAKDARIRVLHQKNGGLSAARNAGLDAARGKWIGFVDSDDYIAPEMYEALYKAVQSTGADLALCDYAEVDETGAPCLPPYTGLAQRIFTGRELLKRATNTMAQPAWNKLYRRDLLVDHQIQFTSEVRWAEDLVFNMQYLEYANVLVSIPEAGYYYVQNPQSICHTQINPASIVQNKIQTFRYYKDLYTRLGMYEEVRPQLYKFLVDIAESTYPSGPFKKIIEEAKEYWKNQKE